MNITSLSRLDFSLADSIEFEENKKGRCNQERYFGWFYYLIICNALHFTQNYLCNE